jgi:hypothetical protein
MGPFCNPWALAVVVVASVVALPAVSHLNTVDRLKIRSGSSAVYAGDLRP